MSEQVNVVALLAVLERIEAKVDASTKRSDERHEETKRELKELRAEIKLLRANDELHQGAVRSVESRMAGLEQRMNRVEAEHSSVKRATDEGDQEQRAAMMSLMHIVQKQQEQLREDFVTAQENTANALASMAKAIPGAVSRLPRWARIAFAACFAFGVFVAGILAGLISHGVIKL